MSNVVDTFMHDRNNLIPGSIPYRLSNLINRNGKYYCIVEGWTDKNFYSNLGLINFHFPKFEDNSVISKV